MLIKIKTSEARVGMFVHMVDGGWLASPFWRSQLLLTRQAQIDKLVDAGIAEIVIDTSRGVGPADAGAATACAVVVDPPEESEPPAAFAPAAPYNGPERRARRRPATELDRARETVERSKEAVSRMFSEVRLGHAVDAAAISPLVDEIAASVARDSTAIIKVTRLKNKDEYTYLHSVAVCALLINLARRMGLPEDEVRDLGMAGMLHDIGKMAVPSALLDKPGKLEPSEFSVVQTHPVKGHALLLESDGVAPPVLDVCLHHHERIDGSGYPHGLSAAQLSLHARMGAICDVYDAVTSDRPYKRPWSPSEALSRMSSWTGHFDPELLAIFIESIGIYPVGTLVRLRSNQLAIVTAVNDEDPTLPVVRAFFDIPTQAFVPQRDLDTARSRSEDTVHRTERGSYWFGDAWPQVMEAVRTGRTPPRASAAPAAPTPLAMGA